ncbi:MAG: hypothetical protein JW894_07715 [Bacteroidales bacterium]|nr:hypothetical protein [Bacteroidales bacterium]
MELKGTAVRAIRDFVLSEFNKQYNRWIDSLSVGSKSIFEGIIDSSKWYPLNYGGVEPTRKIAEMFFGGDYHKGAWESGKYSAQKALSGIYKVFVKASAPGYIVQRASRIFATYYRPCAMKVIERKENSVLLEISNMTESDIVIEYRIAGWINKALEISGAKKITIDLPQRISNGDNITCLDIRWE